MSASVQDVAAIWGAVLSTILALAQGFLWAFKRARLRVTARIQFETTSGLSEDGPVAEHPQVGPQLVRLRIEVTNRGGRAIQISAIYFQLQASVAQVRPDRLPLVLEAHSRAEFIIQKEWLDLGEVKDFGVLDGLGRRHSVPAVNQAAVIDHAKQLPTTVKKRSGKVAGEDVASFKVRDNGIVLPMRR